MTEKRHKITLEVIYYSTANNGAKAYRELDKLLLNSGYKIEKFEHKIG